MRLSRLVVVGTVLTLAAVAVSCAGGASSAAQTQAPRAMGQTLRVTDEASFNAAIARVQGGDTIELTDGVYPSLFVQGRAFSTPVTILGSRNAKIGGMVFDGSTNLVLEGVTLTPSDDKRARIAIRQGSSKITIDRVLVDGRDESVGALIDTNEGTSDVTVRNSELTNCGRKSTCIRPGATKLRIVNNKFVECRSCPFIKGGGNGAFVQGNEFGHAHNVECRGGPANCPHNDMIAIFGGGPWTIVGNRFGQIDAGTAQIYMNPGLSNHDNPIHDVRVLSNIFTGELGHAVRVGVGQQSRTPPPDGVRIVNNTFLSGRHSSVQINPPWAQVAREKHPIVANNIMLTFNDGNCARGHFSSNLVMKGTPCPNDVSGEPKLEERTAAPTAQSSLVVGKADPRYAPETDFFGRLRNGAPDIGAIELGGIPVSTRFGLSLPPLVERRIATLEKARWRLSVSIVVSGAETLRARLDFRGRTVATTTADVRGKPRHTLVLQVPAVARRPGVLFLTVQATAEDGASVKRAARIRLLR